MKFNPEHAFRIHLKARNLSESALVLEFTNKTLGTYEDRLARMKECVDDLIRTLEGEK